MRWYEPVAPRPCLDRVLACTWFAEPSGRHRLVPDACIDVLWLDRGGIWICGPETSSWSFELPGGVTAAGVRFRPGVAPHLLGMAASSIVNRRIRWQDRFGPAAEARLHDQIAARADPLARLASWQDTVADMVRNRVPPDPITEMVLTHLSANPRARATDVASLVALSLRQLQRRCGESFGYGVATLSRILRFHRLWSLIAAPGAGAGAPLARMAAEAGYSDHAHLVRDCRAITGVSPTRFFRHAIPTFPNMSDPFKTAGTIDGILRA